MWGGLFHAKLNIARYRLCDGTWGQLFADTRRINKTEMCLGQTNADSVIVAGDTNTDLNRDNAHSAVAGLHICERYGLMFGWLHN